MVIVLVAAVLPYLHLNKQVGGPSPVRLDGMEPNVKWLSVLINRRCRPHNTSRYDMYFCGFFDTIVCLFLSALSAE